MTTYVNYDVAERLRKLSQPMLFFTMNPDEPGGVVPEDIEGGNPYSYYNIPYSTVPANNVLSTDPNDYGDLTAPLANLIPCSVWDAKFPPDIVNGDVSLCEQFADQTANNDCIDCLTDGIFIIQDPNYCASPVAPIPTPTGFTDFGSQPLAAPVRFSNGVWR